MGTDSVHHLQWAWLTYFFSQANVLWIRAVNAGSELGPRRVGDTERETRGVSRGPGPDKSNAALLIC